MHRTQGFMSKWITGAVVALALAGCDNEQCTKYGEHLADVVIKEANLAVQPSAEERRKLVEKTVDACNAEPPKQEALDCALKAESTKEMKKCEGVDEDAKKE